MLLLGIIVTTALCLGVIFTLISYALFRLQRQSGRQFEQIFGDANQILQTGRPPIRWIEQEQQTITHLRYQGKAESKLASVGNRAKRRCLHQLHTLTRFLADGRFYDSLETREELVEKLEEIYTQWHAASWESLLKRVDK